MVFNSLSFAVFFAIACALYYAPLPWTIRKVVLTLVSYAFYAAWYPHLIVLLWISTLFDWFVTRGMLRANSRRVRQILLVGSVVLNLGLLGFFKYGAFLARNLNGLLEATGSGPHLPVPDNVLPVGISFYTFMSLCSSRSSHIWLRDRSYVRRTFFRSACVRSGSRGTSPPGASCC